MVKCRNVVIIGALLCFIGGALGDEIVKKDGSILKGKIIEHTPGESYKIELADGSIFVVREEEIQTIRFGPIEPRRVPLPEVGPKAPKQSPPLACCLSFVIPGVGQFYNGEYTKGAIFLGADLVCLALMMADMPRYDEYGYLVSGGGPIYYTASAAGLAISIWSMIDAWQGADRLNRARGYGKALINFRDGHFVAKLPSPRAFLNQGSVPIGVELTHIEF